MEEKKDDKKWTQTLTAKTWAAPCTPLNFPENDYLDIPKNSTGLCFSGGGGRALIGATGCLRALYNAGVLNNFDYIGAASGGAWAALIAQYSKTDQAILYGPATNPTEISNETLNQLDSKCLYAPTQINSFKILTNTLLDAEDGRIPAQDVWIKIVSENFLKPHGLDNPDKSFTLNEETANEIIANNPALTTDDFYYANENHPYTIVHGTLIWPRSLLGASHLIPIEFAPAACGVAQNVTLSASSDDVPKDKSKSILGAMGNFAIDVGTDIVLPPDTRKRSFGGYVQSFAFNSNIVI